jgi:hypothetical protein
MSTLLAIDPGESTGFAAFRHGVLSCAWPATIHAEPIRELGTIRGYDACVIERPRFYPGQSKVDANDLIVLALRAGILAQAVAATSTRFVAPSDWKGQLPKNVCHVRIRAILSPLEAGILERDTRKLAASVAHNVLDAVGIGLFALGRFGR